MTNQVSGVVLLLMTSLRQTYNAKMDSSTHPDAFVTMLDETPKEGSKMYSAALQAILKGKKRFGKTRQNAENNKLLI